jgi:hypothetical protein
MKKGDLIKFDFDDLFPAYGTILSIQEDKATIDFKNPITKEHEVRSMSLSQIVKIGNK